MKDYFCPRCAALLSEDYLYTVGQEFDCPECDRRVQLSTVAPELATELGERPGIETFEAENPPGDRVQCRVAGQQLVIFIPPGSSRRVRSIGCFGVLWLAITAAVTIPMVFAGGLGGEVFLVIPFMGLFWAVGLGFLYFWYRGRFGKLYVLVERDRLVTKFELFGREKYREHLLDAQSRARLAESYQENNRSVYCVAVSTTAHDAKFGTFLSREEKDWIVARINKHLGKEVA